MSGNQVRNLADPREPTGAGAGADWRHGVITGSMWDDPAAVMDAAAPPDCRWVWHRRGVARLFHITRATSAHSIMVNGPEARVCKCGFDGRKSDRAFWCGGVPLAIDSVEVWIPHLDHALVAVLAVDVPIAVAAEAVRDDPAWPAVQFAIDPVDVLDVGLVVDCSPWRSRAATERLVGLLGGREWPRGSAAMFPSLAQSAGGSQRC
jgi:hypothetical protein